MAKTIARYSVTSGLQGCYMPDNGPWAYELFGRAALADLIRSEIDAQEFPKATFGQANLRKLWSFIERNGSSSAHFTIVHGDREIAFSGLTEEEYKAAAKEQGE